MLPGDSSGRRLYAAVPDFQHAFTERMRGRKADDLQQQFLRFKAVEVAAAAAVLELPQGDLVLVRPADGQALGGGGGEAAVRVGQLGRSPDEAMARAASLARSVTVGDLAAQPPAEAERRALEGRRAPLADKRDRTHLGGSPQNSPEKPAATKPKRVSPALNHASQRIDQVEDMDLPLLVGELKQLVHSPLLAMGLADAVEPVQAKLQAVAKILAVDRKDQELTGGQVHTLIDAFCRALLGSKMLGKPKEGTVGTLMGEGVFPDHFKAFLRPLIHLYTELMPAGLAAGLDNDGALKLATWFLGKARAAFVDVETLEADAGRQREMLRAIHATQSQAVPAGAPRVAGGGQRKAGSPMIQKITDACRAHRHADGREVCIKFNLAGYGLLNGPKCDGNCGRAHAQVPAVLVRDGPGSQPREWRGGAPPDGKLKVPEVDEGQQKEGKVDQEATGAAGQHGLGERCAGQEAAAGGESLAAAGQQDLHAADWLQRGLQVAGAGEPDLEEGMLQQEGEPATADELAEQRSRAGQEGPHYQPSIQQLPPPLPRGHEDVARRLELMDSLLQSLWELGKGEAPAAGYGPEDDAAWLAEVQQQICSLADATQFQAGGPHQYYEVWRHLFKRAGQLLGEDTLKRRQVKWLLRLLRQGIEPQLVAATAECQFASRTHEARLARCIRELGQLGVKDVGSYLEGEQLRPVQFPNSRKFELLPDGRGPAFLAETRDEWLASGVLERTNGRIPVVVNRLTPELGKPKLRLCVDSVYINTRSKVEAFSYERLGDMRHYLQTMDLLITTDFRRGYQHFMLHPRYWTYFGVEILGEYFVFKVLVFGWSPACKIFTDIMTEVYRVLRLLGGARMTFLIDDQVTACGPDMRLAKARSRCTALLLAALRMYMGLEKCQLLPQHTAVVLGMQVETCHLDVDGSPHCRFLLPEQKLEKLESAGQQLLRSTVWTPRDVASFGGLLVFAYQAVDLAPVLVRTFHLALAGKLSWDETFPPSEFTRQQVQHALEYVRAFNGRRFFKRPVSLVVAADYSSVHGYGAFVVGGSSSEEDRMVVALTPQQQALADGGQLSSTAGELLAKELVVEWLLGHHRWGPRLQHGHIQFEGDNLGAETVLAKGGGGPRTFPIVARIRWRLAEHDCEVSTQWAPREAANQVEADRLSKLEDNGDWCLLGTVAAAVLQHPLLQGRQPTLDPLASSSSMMAPVAYTKVGCPGSHGVDGMGRSWAVRGPAGERPLVWAYPDFGSMAAVVAKLLHERQDAVLVYPDWPRAWRATMMVPQRRADWELGKVMEVSRPSSRVALHLQQQWQAAQKDSRKGLQYKLRCAIFLFA